MVDAVIQLGNDSGLDWVVERFQSYLEGLYRTGLAC